MPRTLTALEDQAYKVLIAKEAQYARAVQQSLVDALDTMRGQMAAIYDKYAVNGKLSLADMTRYNRYVTMEKQMLDTLNPALLNNKRVLNRVPPGMYNASFFHEAWAIDQANNVRLAWGIVNPATVMENLANNMDKIAIARYAPNARANVRIALNNGLPLGKSYATMARDLKQALETTNYNALRIIRTEGQTAINAGQADAYLKAQQQGVEGDTIWDSTLDGRTRPTHADMDGKKKQPDGMYDGPGGERTPYPAWSGLSAAERIHCRCRERFQVEGYSPQLRRSREQGVIPYQTYDKWKANQGPKFSNVKKIKSSAELMVEFGGSLTRLSNLGGSTGAWMAEGVDGKKWAVKQYLNASNPADSIANEYIASQIYRQLGIDVPFSRIATINGQPAFVTEMITGGKELGTFEAKAYLQKKVRKGFVADSFLANWDAVGMSADNMLVTGIGSNAHIHRIDLGGSLLFRAQGTAKGSAFGRTVSELETLLSKNPMGSKWYGTVAPKDIVDQINVLQKNIDLLQIKVLIDSTSLDEALKKELFDTIVQRAQYLEEVRLKLIAGIKADQKTARALKKARKASGSTGDFYPPAPGIDILTDINGTTPRKIHTPEIDKALAKMTSDEREAIRLFTGSLSSELNTAIRTGKGSPQILKQAKDLQSAIRKLPRTDANIYRKIGGTHIDDADWQNWISGKWDTMEWDSFSSTAYGSDVWHGQYHVIIVNNNGKNIDGGLIAGKSSNPGEKEYLVNNGAKFRVLGWAEEAGGGNRRTLLVEPRDPTLTLGHQITPQEYSYQDLLAIFEGTKKIPGVTVRPTGAGFLPTTSAKVSTGEMIVDDIISNAASSKIITKYHLGSAQANKLSDGTWKLYGPEGWVADFDDVIALKHAMVDVANNPIKKSAAVSVESKMTMYGKEFTQTIDPDGYVTTYELGDWKAVVTKDSSGDDVFNIFNPDGLKVDEFYSATFALQNLIAHAT